MNKEYVCIRQWIDTGLPGKHAAVQIGEQRELIWPLLHGPTAMAAN